MEASIGTHYHVILSIPVAICSLLLIVFVTVFCISHHKKDCESQESLDAGESQRLLDGTPTIQTESRGKRINEPQQAKVENWVLNISEHSASASVRLNSNRVNVSKNDRQGKSHSTKKVSPGQDGEVQPAISTHRQVQLSSTKTRSKQNDSNGVNHGNTSDKSSTSTNVKVTCNAPKDEVCSQLQDGSTQSGAGHRNSGKGIMVNQSAEKVKSKGVASNMPVLNTHGDQYLTSNDIREVIEKVWNARAKWYHIGIELGISVHDLNAIKNGANHHDIDSCFTDMLVIWLQQPRATWEALANALRSEPVGYPQLAESIVPTSSAASYETTVDDSTSEGVMAFNCGCPTPCNLIDHLNGKCPNSLKLFPYLDSNKLTKKEQFDLEAKLCRETKAIVTEFAKLTKRMRKSLVDQQVHPKEVLSSVLGIAPSKSSTCPLLETLDVNSVTSVYDIIIHLQLKSYISFFNYDIVEYLINEYGTDEDKAELAEYIRHFQDFCQRSVFEIPHRVHGHPPKESTQLAIKVVPKCQWSRFSLGDAKNVQIKIAGELNLPNCASVPLFEISKGCVRLTFALPKVIMELVKPKLSARLNINRGKDKYLIHILCGPPGTPFATNITSDSVSLQWTKPEYQGTLSLTHYVVYHRIHTGRWDKKKLTLTSGLQESVTVKGLSHKDGAASFVFKVEAVSKLGVNVESKESDPIQLSVSTIILSLYSLCML